MQNLWGDFMDIIDAKQLDNKAKQFNNTEEQSYHSSQLSHIKIWLWSMEELEKSLSFCALWSFIQQLFVFSCLQKYAKTDSDLDWNSEKRQSELKLPVLLHGLDTTHYT